MGDGKHNEALDVRLVRLHTWKRDSLPVSCSNEAMFSPFRDMLLLQTTKCEAVIGFLQSIGNISEEETQESQVFRKQSPTNLMSGFSISEKRNYSSPRYAFEKRVEDLYYTNTSSRTAQGSSMESAFISDFMSGCWGAIEEGYSANRHVGVFKELLFTVGKHGLIIHGFPAGQEYSTLDEISDDQTKGGKSRGYSGRWVNWGFDNFGSTADINRNDDMPSETQSKGLVTFLLDSEVKRDSGVARLLFQNGKGQLPIGLMVSYSILYRSTAFFKLMDYCKERIYKNGEHNINGSHLEESKSVLIGKVFSGSSFNMIGMLFHVGDNNEIGTSNERRGFFILICRILQSGLEWFSVIEPQKHLMHTEAPHWPRFAISGCHLFGLHEKGHVYLWSVVDATIVVTIDVLQHSYSQHFHHVAVSKQELHKASIAKSQSDRSSVEHRSRKFLNMVLAPDSSFIAMTDSFSVIYVLPLAHHFSHGLDSKRSDIKYLPSKSLCDWALGSRVIGAFTPQLLTENVSSGEVSAISSLVSSSCSSGFSDKSNLSGLRSSGEDSRGDCGHPLMQIFLPMDHAHANLTISLNPFGITGIVKFNNELQHGILFKMLLPSKEVFDDTFYKETSKLRYVQLGLDSQRWMHVLPINSHGYLYFISQDGLYVVLPPSVSTSKLPDALEGRWWFTGLKSGCALDGVETYSRVNRNVTTINHWQIDILDKIIIYEGLHEAEHFAAVNGWSQKIVRLRRLQLVLDYAEIDQVEQALDDLVNLGAAGFGVPRVLFSALELMVASSSGDNELGQASRLLSITADFVIKLIREYGMLALKQRSSYFSKESKTSQDMSCNLHEMSRFLEVTRKMQYLLQLRRSRPQSGKKEGNDEVTVDNGQDHSSTSRPSVKTLYPEETDNELGLSEEDDSKWLVRVGENGDKTYFERSHEMFYRWQKQNIDLPEIVRDALRAGRLPLAVVQLHHLKSSELVSNVHGQNVFKEVQFIGRAFVYELFCKGETAKAMIALSRLGEDMETVLRELAFGTVSRFMRSQVVNELAKLGCLNSEDLNLLRTVSILERIYPSSSFWWSYGMHQKALPGPIQSETASSNSDLQISCSLKEPHDIVIKCGEAHGVVLGNWNNVEKSSTVDSSLDELSPAYWAGAAVWLKVWDERTFDRVCIDQDTLLLDMVSWEARLQAAISRNDWTEVSVLLDFVPDSVLSDGEIRVRLDCPDVSLPDHDYELRTKGNSQGESYGLDVDAVETVIPGVKILSMELGNVCTNWILRMLSEKLARSHIFLYNYWYGTTDLISLLARAGMLCRKVGKDRLENQSIFNDEAEQAIHELVLRHCVRHSLPNFLGIYLDYHSLALESMSSVVMQAVVGDCQWALWLLSSRIKGHEYDMSFANARTVLAHNFKPGILTSASEMEEFILTVDDIAMIGGEIIAICTLMYAPIVLEKCLCTGSVSRYDRPSWQCTLENLRPISQLYPTLWRTVFAACLTPDAWCLTNSHPKTAISLRTKSKLPSYLQWRDKLFSSACGDTSILQMMPPWIPKGVRKLLQLTVQGSVGVGQGNFQIWDERAAVYSGLMLNELDPVAWENALRKHIEDELYASSKLEDKALGVDHHLRRGRAMAAFHSLLALRLQNLSSQESLIREHVGKFQRGQVHMSSELNAVLAPLSTDEEKYLATVLPLAIMNFENPVVVAAASSFLELCGFPAMMLRVDVAALCRISSFCKLKSPPDMYVDSSVLYENDIAASLARALADDYMEVGVAVLMPKNPDTPGKLPVSEKMMKTLLKVLQALEKASIVELPRRDTSPGTWLMNGIGDGSDLRSQQRESSEKWSLVTAFCNAHQLPISTVYLKTLAKDNDWVGFLAEAQSEGCPLETVIAVASQEFTDSRLQSHILTVLKSFQTAWQKPPSVSNISSEHESPEAAAPSELFEVLADCEQQKCPGTTLLRKAKEMHWPLLAVVSSCFDDVTATACLSVWLEITAARETSSTKESDSAANIAAGVGAAVEATNRSLDNIPVIDFQYNRKNPKRRCVQSADRIVTDIGNLIGTSEGRTDIKLDNEDSIKRDFRKPNSDFNQKASKEPRNEAAEEQESLLRMILILCEKQSFFPLLKAFELFMPSSSLLPFIRFLQAFSQRRLSEASTHLTLFSARLKDEYNQTHIVRSGKAYVGSWISVAAITAADALLAACPSAYERRCLLKLLANADFGDGGAATRRFQRLYCKIQLTEPSLQQDPERAVDGASLNDDDDTLLQILESQRKWEQARSWARELERSGRNTKAVHHVTEIQAEAMVMEWREFLWDIPEERVALWNHCNALFIKHSLPPYQAGSFFKKHADRVEQEVSKSELHGILLLALQWLSGKITNTQPASPLHLLGELETRIWLLAVESESEIQGKQLTSPAQAFSGSSTMEQEDGIAGINHLNPINNTAKLVSVVENHIRNTQSRATAGDADSSSRGHPMSNQPIVSVGMSKSKRRPRNNVQKTRTPPADKFSKSQLEEEEEDNSQVEVIAVHKGERKASHILHDVNGESYAPEEHSLWADRVGEQELERAALSLLEVGQVSAAKRLQQKLASAHSPLQFLLVETALAIANQGSIDYSKIPPPVTEHLLSSNLIDNLASAAPLEVLEAITKACPEGSGHGSCRRITVVARIANSLGLSFVEAFEKPPTQLLQLLSLKAQDSYAEAKMLVETHSMPPVDIARILAESFLKGLVAAHRGGYLEAAQSEEGPFPLLWRSSDFLKWARLCQSEADIGHALMHLILSGHDIPNACEVELLVYAYGFYMSSACLRGIDVLLTFASTRVDSYHSEKDFKSLARLVTGINNFQALHFVLDMLIEDGQLELLLQKRAAVEAAMESSTSVRGFRMAVLSTLKYFCPDDLDAFGKVFKQFDMKYEMAALVESRARKTVPEQFDSIRALELTDELLEAMRYNVEAAEAWADVDAGKKARWNCARASLISLQIRIPETQWLNLPATQARRLFVEQARFEQALVVAEAYNLNQPSEWAPVLWHQMSNPGVIEPFLGEFVAALPLPPSMLMELARYYRAEVTGRERNIDFSSWLSPGGLPLDWARYLEKSFRCLLKYVRDVRLRVQLATLATGFTDVLDVCARILDKVPETAGPLILRKAHGGGYLPLM